MLPSFYHPIDELIGEDEPSNSSPSVDHNTDELPFGVGASVKCIPAIANLIGEEGIRSLESFPWSPSHGSESPPR
jgi:hypothetical protein